MRAGGIGLCLGLLVSAPSSWAVAGTADPQVVLESGIHLSCHQNGPALLDCDYRLLTREAVQRIVVMVGSGEVTDAKANAYLSGRPTSAVLFLVDVGGSPKPAELERKARDLTSLLEKADSHHRVGVSVFSGESKPLAELGTPPATAKQALKDIRPGGKTSELYRNALAGVRLLADYPADRRALFLLSDGLADDYAYHHQDVVRAALNGGVIIYGLGYPDRQAPAAALQTLRRLSAETGGIYIQVDETHGLPADFAENPYFFLDSGGNLQVDLSGAIASGLRGAQPVGITLTTVTGAATVSVTARLPEHALDANEGQPTRLIAAEERPQRPPVPLPRPRESEPTPLNAADVIDYLLLGGVLSFIALALVWGWQRRKPPRKEAVASPVDTPYAFLAFLDEPGRKPHPIESAALRIGRHRDNDLRLQDPSVSRHHAEIQRQRDGSFSITDLDSLNGVYVNDRQIKTALLAEGDLVEVGDVRLRFNLRAQESASAKASQDPEQTLISRPFGLSHGHE